MARSVPTVLLLFDQDYHGPCDDFRVHFEALARHDPEERQLVKGLIESGVKTNPVSTTQDCPESPSDPVGLTERSRFICGDVKCSRPRRRGSTSA